MWVFQISQGYVLRFRQGGLKMTPKECLIQFKETYCEKDPKNIKDPEFRCYKCLFRQDNICLINAFISRQCAKED